MEMHCIDSVLQNYKKYSNTKPFWNENNQISIKSHYMGRWWAIILFNPSSESSPRPSLICIAVIAPKLPQPLTCFIDPDKEFMSVQFLCPQRNFGRHIVIALSIRPSVRPSVPLSCLLHISYILCGRNSKFGVWIHLGMAECRVPFSGHCDLDLDL